MRLFHRTWAIAASTILKDGFADGKEGFVWLSDELLEGDDIKIGEGGDVSLTLEVADDVIAKHPMIQRAAHKAYQIPASELFGCHMTIADTDYAGMTRDELLAQIAGRQEEEKNGKKPPKEGSKWSTSQSYCEALAFLDQFAPLP